MTGNRQLLPPHASLSVTAIDGPKAGQRIVISSLPAVLGQGEKVEVVVEGKGVMARHARLVFSGDALFLEDLGSGETKVNGSPVRRMKLENGDLIELGEAKLLLQLDLPAGTAIPELKKEKEAPPPRERGVWLAGFPPEVREWFQQKVGAEIGLATEVFHNGEEVLIALSQALSQNHPPALLILDLKLPLVNGINIALVVRAFELGYRRAEHIPLVFLFEPPPSTSFDKVVKFCQPLKVVSPPDSSPETLKLALSRLIAESDLLLV